MPPGQRDGCPVAGGVMESCAAGRLKPGRAQLQVLCKDSRTLAAGGGVEMEIAQQLGEMARKETGLEQYAIAKFAEALEVSGRPPLLHSWQPPLSGNPALQRRCMT